MDHVCQFIVPFVGQVLAPFLADGCQRVGKPDLSPLLYKLFEINVLQCNNGKGYYPNNRLKEM
jgi:hypothetical protein